MLREKTAIGPGLMFMFLLAALFGSGIMLAPQMAAEAIGPNGYWGVAVAGLLSLLVVAAAIGLGKRFPRQSIIAYLPRIYGVWLGKLLGLIFLLFLLAFGVLFLRAIADIFSSFFLFRSPYWATLGLILLAVAYPAYLGIEVISRQASFLFVAVYLLITVILLMSFHNFQLDHVRPVLTGDPLRILHGGVRLFYCYYPLAMLFMVYQYFTEPRHGWKALGWAVLVIFVYLFLIVFGAIGVYGAKGVLRYSFPVLELTRKTTVPYLLQTFGLYFSFVWLSQVYITLAGLLYTTAQGCAEWFGILNYKRFVLIVAPLVLVLAVAIPGAIDLRALFKSFQNAGVWVAAVLPLLTWAAAWLFKRGEQNGP